MPDDQLSLAIGKEGQNARLAVRLTGVKIDIKSKSQEEAVRAAEANSSETGSSEADPSETDPSVSDLTETAAEDVPAEDAAPGTEE